MLILPRKHYIPCLILRQLSADCRGSVGDYLLRKELSYGVMVTLQILDLPFLVRIQVAQRKEKIPH